MYVHRALVFVGVVSMLGKLYRKSKLYLTGRSLVFMLPLHCRVVGTSAVVL